MFKVKRIFKKLSKKQSLGIAMTVLTLSFSVSSISYHKTAEAQGIQRQLDNVFNSMSNTTRPGVFETQRRGVIAGGRHTIKNKIYNENIVSFVPPSFSGSCGGIDIFGGSFSFINSEQLIALLRSIAANAATFAFYTALKNICESCASIMSALQKSIQSLNEFMGNSCQLAQGIVNDTFGAFDLKKGSEASFVAQADGLIAGFFDGWMNIGGEKPEESIEKNKPTDSNDFIGNMVWEQLKKHNVRSWYNNGDNELSEAIMSLSGTIIVHPMTDAPDAVSGSSTPDKSSEYTLLSGHQITLKDLVEGGQVQVYDCSGDYDKCMKKSGSKKTLTIVGLKQQIQEVYLGKGSSPGYIAKYHTMLNVNEQEKAFSSNMPAGVHVLVQKLALKGSSGVGLAENFITEKSGAIALVMANQIITDLLDSIRIAMNSDDTTWKEKILPEIDRTYNGLSREFNQLLSEYGGFKDIMDSYNASIRFDPSNRLLNLSGD